jgi:hypothetical protein
VHMICYPLLTGNSMYSKCWNPRSYHIVDQREVVNCVPLFVAVGTLSRSWEMAHHNVLVHLGEISLLALGFCEEELYRSCHACWQSPHMAAMFFLLSFTQNMHKPCYAMTWWTLARVEHAVNGM